MKSLWSDREARAYRTPLALRVYTSRLLGRDRSLVLHGGGNTSVKLREPNLFGEGEDVLYVKGSGWDLETIEEAGFTPVRLHCLIRLSTLERLTDPEMVNELQAQKLKAVAPAPSVESILHAILPYRYVDHTHADAVLAITNTRDGRRRVEEIYAESAVVIPYVMPGFDLARLCAREFPRRRGPHTTGMILMNHGVFSFGDDARESYERMIALVDRAERYLKLRKAWSLPDGRIAHRPMALAPEIARLRRDLSAAAGVALVVSTSQAPAVLRFCRRADMSALASQGPATPDHSLRTKRVPLIGRDVGGYVRTYRRYFEAHAAKAAAARTMLDPAPRIVLDRELGLCGAGRSARDADIARELYAHNIEVMQRADALGDYRALSARDVFDVEYWDLEQAKLKSASKPPELGGEIALVTGGASGIGRACVDALLARGAAVVALDIDPAVVEAHAQAAYLGRQCDVTDRAAVARSLEAAVRRFGGLDMLILNAGSFPGEAPLAELAEDHWRSVMAVNVDANLALMKACHPLLALAPNGARVVIVGSKNVPAPGPGVAAYSASKAALTQLGRSAALEWGKDGIRVNVVHPDAVFDTGLWNEQVLAARAARYGLSIEAYKTRNVLRAAVKSADVARLICAMCGPAFVCTTGAQVPIDGGNDRVI